MSSRSSTRRMDVFWFATRINVYAISLTALWTPLNAVLIQQRISDTVPPTIQASALGLISLIGIGIAALIQPMAGRASDVAPFPDRRRPFIVGGTLVDLLVLIFLWWAPSFTWLFVAYVLLQISSNVAQAAFQALIPDLTPPPQVGLVAGVKNAFDVLGGALGLLGVGLLLGLRIGSGATYLFLAVILGLGAALTLVWVPPIPPLLPPRQAANVRDLLKRSIAPAAFALDPRRHRAFSLAIVVRFLFLLGFYPIQRFFFFYLEDRFAVAGAAQRTSFYALGALLLGAAAATAAGTLSDRFGRLIVLRTSIVISAVGLLGIAFAPSLLALAIVGSLLALGSGAFQAVNWALLSDHIPPGRGAQFYGFANVATAGASALAGLFGPLVDALNALLPASTYLITFSLAALVTLTSLLPLRRIWTASPGRSPDTDF